MRLLTAVSLTLFAIGCGVDAPTAPARPSSASPAVHATELRAFYAPMAVYVGGSAQIHVGTFAQSSSGAVLAVYDRPCTFQTDAGYLSVAPQGVDTSWHVAIVATDQTVADRVIHVQATCDDLSTTVTFNVAPLGAKPPLVPPSAPPPPPVAGCITPNTPGCPTT